LDFLVCCATDTTDGNQEVAVKVAKNTISLPTTYELSCLQQLNHENIIKFKRMDLDEFDENECVFVMEFAPMDLSV
jgi:hypothetical protein